MNPSCHICGTAAKYLFKKDNYDEYICPNCHLSFVYPQPDADWLKDEVYSLKSGYQGNKKMDLSSTPPDLRTWKALKFLSRKKAGGKLLDVGCSNGALMYWAGKMGRFKSDGVEINRRTAEIAKANGFNVHQGFIETAPFQKGIYDVIYIGDVIEHVNSPRDFLRTCLTFLAKDGLIAISTPNVDCLWCHTTLRLAKIFGIPWSSATPPHHLYQFSESNLDSLVSEFGMQPVKSIFTGPSSLRYELGSLHLYGAWKRQKSFKNLFKMVVAFTSYTVIFGISRLLGPFLRRRFEMVKIYEKR